MRRTIFVSLFGIALMAQFFWFPVEAQNTPKAPSKGLKKSGKKAIAPVVPAEEPYDPDKLAPSEVACGRIGSQKAPPCGCMKHRLDIRDEAVRKCDFIEDRNKRLECFVAVPHCPAVSDRDNPVKDADGNNMPPQCKRWCSKARCECCTS